MARVFRSLRFEGDKKRPRNVPHEDHLYSKRPENKLEELEINENIDLVLNLPQPDEHSAVLWTNNELSLKFKKPYVLVRENIAVQKSPPKKRVKGTPKSRISQKEFQDHLVTSVGKLSLLGKYNEPRTVIELRLVLEDFSCAVRDKKIPPWDRGFEALSDLTLREAKGFWTDAQLLQSNEKILEDAMSYLSSFAPPIFACVDYHLRKYCAAELLRHLLNLLEIHVERVEVEFQKESDSLKSINVPVKFDTKEVLRKLQILYFVAGSTVNSICKSKAIARDFNLRDSLAIKGAGNDIKQYLSEELPNLEITSWVMLNDRGGLLYVKKGTFIFFQTIDKIINKFYDGKTLADNNPRRREEARDAVIKNDTVKDSWKTLLQCSEVPNGKEDFVLRKLTESYLKLRGNGLQLYLRAKYFGKKNENLRSQASLRKGLKQCKENKKASGNAKDKNLTVIRKDFTLPLKVKGIVQDRNGCDIFLV